MTDIESRLNKIEELLTEQTLLKKEVLNIKEASRYLKLSQSHLYKLTSTGEIPHYKPNGKMVYFNRQELDNWLLRNRQASADEIETMATNYSIFNSPKKF
jgi:excisionase family DNA binding protein